MVELNRATPRFCCLVVVVAVLLTVLFWGPLWIGYGFVGGDLYPYFFPQKTFLAERLHAGEFPLWNNLTGFGYPILGESQTAVAYPPHFVAYYFLDANSAYNVEHLAHYVLCFITTWLFANRIGMNAAGSLLTSLVFTYGWFPPRACLEWAIVTGAWLPVCLWCVESFVQTGRWRFSIGLSIALGLQLLAGHFHLAFITQLLVVTYGAWRIWLPVQVGNATSVSKSQQTITIAVLTAIIGGFLLASVQLLPAWELKTRSSRATVGEDHDPSYGHLPPQYASQLAAPWLWYSPLEIDGDGTIRTIAELGAPWHWFGPHRSLDESLMQSRAGGLTNTATNKVEAHLYCGLLPLLLAVVWVISTGIQGSQPVDSALKVRRETTFWLICGIAALIYATGWLLPVARHIPGFNFFRGPGRYGIVSTMAIAIFAGRGLDRLLTARPSMARLVLVGCVFGSTICDLWLVSRMVTYAVMVSRPPISFREDSEIRKLLLKEQALPRLYAPGQNVGNLLGVSCVPVYLGIAPSEYSDPKFAGLGRPKPLDDHKPVVADREFSTWLRDSGVTHVLAFDPLDQSSWQADLVWQGMDAMLNRVWGQWKEPLYLYKLRDAKGRVSFASVDPPQITENTAKILDHTDANRFAVEVKTMVPTKVIARELAYPGWEVTVDDQPAVAQSHGVFRAVDVSEGSHQIVWTYRPWSFKAGLAISLVTLFGLGIVGFVGWRKS